MNQQRQQQSQGVRRIVPHPRSYLLVVAALTLLPACEAAYTSVDTTPSEPRGEAGEAPSASGGATSNDPGAVSDWCAVERVLFSKCQRCHGEPALHGAPFSLLNYEATQAVDRHGKPRYLVMQRALESGAMPPLYLELEPPVAALTDDEKQLLLHWCDASAPGPGDEPCPEL